MAIGVNDEKRYKEYMGKYMESEKFERRLKRLKETMQEVDKRKKEEARVKEQEEIQKMQQLKFI